MPPPSRLGSRSPEQDGKKKNKSSLSFRLLGHNFRCLCLARCYSPVKSYAEALTLIQHANVHLREARATMYDGHDDPHDHDYYPLAKLDVDALDGTLGADGLQLKKDWFAHSGGGGGGDGNEAFTKPLFFDIALNYVQVDVDRLRERAGMERAPRGLSELPASGVERKAKVEREREGRTDSEPQTTTVFGRGGLSGLLGGWWGRT